VNAPGDGFKSKSQSFLSVKLLGTGGFSTVDEVLHRETQLRISRKTLKNREPSAMQELKKEVDVLRKLRHPHIIRFIGAYTKDDKVSILLSPVAETTLAVWLETCYSEKPIGLADTVLKMFGCLASSIRYLHEQRPVVKHMDIKPQNILVMHGTTDIPHVVLCDFGISSSEDLAQDQDSKPLTRQYCAPEVPAGLSREQAADIWSLGCVYLEMLAAALSQDNSQWLDFRKEFSGREGKYYWQEVPRLQDWLSNYANQATGLKEENALWAIKSMLNGEPSERPDAATLTMVFTPASCCLSWPNEGVSFPGPMEELNSVEMLVRDDGEDCLAEVHVCNSVDHKTKHEPFARARTWLDECSHDHDACRRPETGAKMLPTRLLDIQPDDSSSVRVIDSTCLTSSPTKVDYLAINYVWNSTDLTLSTDRLNDMQTKIPREQLPVAINDALTAAARIGFRYVWVDSLCVVQDSIEDKQSECTNMASVYRNATMTIVVDKAHDHDPLSIVALEPTTFANTRHLTSTRSSDTIDEKRTKNLAIDWSAPGFGWDTRAWVLQERMLCGRLLHLTGEQMYWECNALKASETFPHGLPSLVWEKVHTKSTSSAIDRAAVAQTCTSLGMRVLKNQQFLRRQGDSHGDVMSTSTQLDLKAHSADARRRNCRSPPSRSHSLKHDKHELPLPMGPPASDATPCTDVSFSNSMAKSLTTPDVNFSVTDKTNFTFRFPFPFTHVDSERVIQVSNYFKEEKDHTSHLAPMAQKHSKNRIEQAVGLQGEGMDIDVDHVRDTAVHVGAVVDANANNRPST
jgi:serine/threonine protein kinase